MGLADIEDPEPVRKAISEYEDLGRREFLAKHGFSASLRYVLRLDGRLYDSKAILGVAHGYAFPNEGALAAADFSGGVTAAAKKLGDLGFEVVDLDQAHPRVWIEKAHVKGRDYRTDGPLRIGAAVWSPQKSVKGSDIYRFMRDVEADDYVLHFTDGEAFTGISRVASKVEALTEVPEGIPSAGREHQVIWLKDFEKLDPPLTRGSLFSAPIWDRLASLLDIGVRHNFFNKAKELNQGHYFTPAMPDLVEILNDAYDTIAGQPLVDPHELPGRYGGGDAVEEVDQSLEALATITNLSLSEAQELVSLLSEKKHLILEGPPGAGKTWVAKYLARHYTGNSLDDEPTDHRVAMLQFHQTYGYEDFVQGIRPRTTEAGTLHYQVEAGRFLRFCASAVADEGPHVLIIDEINRGNISRIFGELLLLLEYRDDSVELPYASSDAETSEVPKYEEFKVPKNVHIIGTMNTADRSLAQIDYALRRRFFFYRLSPIEGNDAPILRRWLKDNPEVPGPKAEEVLKLFVALNKKIAGDLGEDFHIGHSHFMSSRVATAEGLDRIWRRSVEPLLNEYFHNRKDRQELVDSYRFDRVTSEAFLGEEGEPTGNDG